MAVRVLARPAQLLIPERNSIFDPRAEGVSLGLGSRLWGLPLSLPPQPLVRKLSGFRRCTVRAARQKLWKNRNRGSSQTVIKGLLEALQHEGANVQEVLERKGAFLPANDWFQVLEAVGKERRWLLALEIFRWMQLQKWYKPDNGYYAKLISIMGKEKQLRLAMWLFAEMKRKGLRPNTSMYNAVISAQVAMSNIPGTREKGLSLLEEMKERKQKYSQPSIVTYNILLKAFADVGDFDRVNLLFDELQEAGLGPDLYTLNVIIGAYGRGGYVEKMEAIYSTMTDMGCKADAVTLNSLINAYGKAGQFEKAENLLQRMVKSKKTPAEVKTFNSLIYAYGQAGFLEKMEIVAERLIDAGHAPSAITFEIMIVAYGKGGDFSRMRECVEAMKVTKLEPSYATCKFILEKLCESRLFERAEEVLADSFLSGFVSEATLYNVVLKAYALEGRRADIDRLLHKMTKAGVCFDRGVLLDILNSYEKEKASHSDMKAMNLQ